jgi:hypothetical protein
MMAVAAAMHFAVLSALLLLADPLAPDALLHAASATSATLQMTAVAASLTWLRAVVRLLLLRASTLSTSLT